MESGAVGSTAIWIEDSVVYSLHVVNMEGDIKNVRQILEQLLAYY